MKERLFDADLYFVERKPETDQEPPHSPMHAERERQIRFAERPRIPSGG